MSLLLRAPDAAGTAGLDASLLPHGHRLGPYRLIHGWMPCGCAGVDPERGRGHHWTKCLACGDEGRRTFYYEPCCRRAEHRRDAVVTLAGPGGAWVVEELAP
jgi:hypothetical protein